MSPEERTKHIQIAREYRAEVSKPGCVVILWFHKVMRSEDALPTADAVVPGMVAVDANDCVYLAHGGDDHNGAQSWKVQGARAVA